MCQVGLKSESVKHAADATSRYRDATENASFGFREGGKSKAFLSTPERQ